MEKLDLKIFPYSSDGRGLSEPAVNNISEDIRTKNYVKLLIDYSNLKSQNQNKNQNKNPDLKPFPLTLVSSVYGKIETLVFHYPDMKSFSNAKSPGLHHLIKNLATKMSNVKFIVVSNKKAKSTISRPNVETYEIVEKDLLEIENNNTIEFVKLHTNNYEDFSVWASDVYKSGYYQKKTEEDQTEWHLIDPHLLIERRGDDQSVFFERNEKMYLDGFKSKKFDLSFDGGNILVGDEFILMGKNIEDFNTRNGLNVGNLEIKISSLLEELEKRKISFYEMLSNLTPLFDDNKMFWEQLENIKAIEGNNKNNLFSDSWKSDLRNDTDLKELLKKISIKELFEAFIGVGKKVHFIGQKIESIDDEYLLDKDNIHLSAIGDSLKGNGKQQPLFHLDYFITLAGKSNGEYQLVIGNPVVGLSDEKLASLSQGTLGLIYTQICKMRNYINNVIDQLEKIKEHKFNIIRIPLPLTYHNFVENDKIKFKWYWASYNNCLVEIDGDSKTVWLPSYIDNYKNRGIEVPTKLIKGFAKYYKINAEKINKEKVYGNWKDLAGYEGEVKKIWAGIGFNNVKSIKGDMHWYAQHHGSLACLINCIKRKVPPFK